MPLQDPDDIYSDPQTIGDDDDDADDNELAEEEKQEISQTPFLTEKQGDLRGPIDELEEGGEDGYDPDNDQERDSADSRDGTDA